MSEAFLLPKWFDRSASLNSGVLGALWGALQSMNPQAALSMIDLAEAAGRHLETHGSLYGVKRNAGESDGPYRLRILAEVLNPRSTPVSIAGAVMTVFPGSLVSVLSSAQEATAQGVKLFDASWVFDGTEFFRDVVAGAGGSYGIFNVDIESTPSILIDLGIANEVVERIRAAGCIPTIREIMTLDYVLNPPNSFWKPLTVNSFDGVKKFDSSWAFIETAAPLSIAFGDGGVDANGNPLLPLDTLTAVRNEVARDSNLFLQSVTVNEVVGEVSFAGVGGVSINEVGLLGTGDHLIAYASFPTRVLLSRTAFRIRFLY